MSTSITEAFVTRFSARVHHLGQQRVSRLRNTVYSESDRADIFTFDRLANSEMVTGGSRHATITVNDVAHSRRRAQVIPADWTELVDRRDAVRILQNAGANYVMAAAQAHGRQIDRVLTDAMVSNTKTTDGSGAAVAFPAGQKIGAGTGKFTLDLWRQAVRKLNEAEVGDETGGERHIAINAKALQDALEVTEITSADYNTVRALVDGSLNTFLGCNVIRTELLPAGTPQGKWQFAGDNVTGVGCLVWERNCVGLAIADDKFSRYNENPERKNSTQVYMEMTLGGCRIEDEGIVLIDIAQ